MQAGQDWRDKRRGRAGMRSLLAAPFTHAVWAVGLTQIIGWGANFYCLAVLGRPIAAAMGWSQSLVFGGMTLALLLSGAISTPLGRFIDRRGGRLVMVWGFLLAAAGHLTVAAAQEPWVYLAGWGLLGVAMRMSLYDAAFAAMVQLVPDRGRRAISYLTLFGGLASTVFWPLGYGLEAALGWRGTLVVFAALNALVAAPLVGWGLSRRIAPEAPVSRRPAEAGGEDPADVPPPPLSGEAKSVAIVLFALGLAANQFVFGALSAHLPSVLETAGVAAAAAVWLAALKGMAQVAGRIWEIVYAQSWSPVTLGRFAIGLLPVSFAVLLAGGASFEAALAFTLLLGVSNGLVTIVRGAVPLALFGREGYGAMLGLLATPQLVMSAVAPFVFAGLVEALGPRAGLWALTAAALISVVAMEATARWVRRARRG